MSGTTDAFAALPLKLEEVMEANREVYLTDAEDALEVRTACAIVQGVLKQATLRQQAMFGPTDATYHVNWDALGPVYGQLVPIMEACNTAISELSDPDTDEIYLAFVMQAVIDYLDGLDTTVRETY